MNCMALDNDGHDRNSVDQYENDINMVDDVDDLDAYIAERDKREPGFAALVEEKLRLRQAARARGEDPNAMPMEEQEAEEQPATPNAKP